MKTKKKVSIDRGTGCWNWLGYKNKAGYGRCRVGGKNIMAHRLYYTVFNGAIPDGIFALHKCDNPSCVNPDHIFLGTKKDNMADCKSKGRMASVVGVLNPRRKLTESDVLKIKECGIENQRLTALRFGVSQKAVWNIVHGKSWTHIK